MQKYLNKKGDSNVSEFQIEENSITVKFKNGAVYLFTNESSGQSNISEMKRLAMSGSGLNGFIKRVVKTSYAKKTRI